MAEILKLSKLDAARRQMDVAIELLFNDGDPVATHTLAASAHRILRDVCDHRKITATILFDLTRIRKGMEKEYLRMANGPGNFFKHADKDQDATFDFNPVGTELQLFDAVICYEALAKARTRNMTIFSFHFALTHHSYFYPGFLTAANEAFPVKKLKALSRSRFFEFFVSDSFAF